MKCVLVTGASGFIGRNLIPQLDSEKYKILAPPRSECNLIDFNSISNFFAKHSPDYVIHLASHLGGIGYIRSNAAQIYYDNILVNTHLIEACRAYLTEKLIVLNTINAYPAIAKPPYKEQDLYLGDPEETIKPYGLSKKLSIYQSKLYFEQFGLSSLHLICDGIYGPNDLFDLKKSRVIPANIIRFDQARKNKTSEVVCWGSGSATRSFIYVFDVVDTIIKMLSRKFDFDYVNLGNSARVSIKLLVEKIANLTGYYGDIKWDATKPEGQLKRYLCCDKLKDNYQIEAAVSLDDGLKNTVSWYNKKISPLK